VKSGIFGIESGYNGGVQGGRLCHESSNSSGLFGGAKGPSNRLKRARLKGAGQRAWVPTADRSSVRTPDHSPIASVQAPPPSQDYCSSGCTPAEVWPLCQIRWEAPAGAEDSRARDRPPSFSFSKVHANVVGYGAAFGAHLKTHKVIGPTIFYWRHCTSYAPVFLFFVFIRPLIRSLDCGRNKATTHAVVVQYLP